MNKKLIDVGEEKPADAEIVTRKTVFTESSSIFTTSESAKVINEVKQVASHVSGQSSQQVCIPHRIFLNTNTNAIDIVSMQS